MGYVELSHFTENDSDGATITFSVTSSTQDLSYPEQGTISIAIRVVDDAQILHYGCSVLVAEWSKRWFNHFVCIFCQDQLFRLQWRLPHPTERIPSITKPVYLQGRTIELDIALADAIVALNAAGAMTNFSCQGRSTDWSSHPSKESHSESAYISLAEGQFPPELMQAARNAGCLVIGSELRAYGPLRDIAQANRQFVRLINDWWQQKLDLSGQAYRIKPVPRSTLPVLPPLLHVRAEPDPSVQRLIALDDQATVNDLLALPNREDRYTRLGYTTLLECIPVPIKVEVEAQTGANIAVFQASVYRWYLRGLPVHLALKKVVAEREKRIGKKKSWHHQGRNGPHST